MTEARALLAAVILALVCPASAQAPPAAEPGFECNWQDLQLRERRRLPARDVVVQQPWLEVRFQSGEFFPLEACGRLVGVAWRGSGEVVVHDPGPERAHLLHDRFETLPGTVLLEGALLVSSDGTLEALLEAAEAGLDADAAAEFPEAADDAPWRESSIPVGVRQMVLARTAPFDPIKGKGGRPPGALLYAPDPALGGTWLDLKVTGVKRSYHGGDIQNPLRWLTGVHSDEAGYLSLERTVLMERTAGSTVGQTIATAPPPEVMASAGDAFGERTRRKRFDIKDVEVQVFFDPTFGVDRDLQDVKVAAAVTLEAEEDAGAFVPLWLTEGRSRTLGEQWGVLDVHSVHVDGVGVGYDRIGSRLFVHLPEPLAEGTSFRVDVRYSGPLVEPAGQTAITPLSGWSWYPSNVVADRHTFTSVVTAPVFWKIVSTGRRIEELEDGKARVVTSRETRPVLRGHNHIVDCRVETIPPPSPALPLVRILSSPKTVAITARFGDEVHEHLTVLNELLGPFPYKELEIVERYTGGSYQGPGVIALSTFDSPPDQVITTNVGGLTLLQALVRQYLVADMGGRSYHDTWLIEGLGLLAECEALEAAGKPGRCGGYLSGLRRSWLDLVGGRIEQGADGAERWLIGSMWLSSMSGSSRSATLRGPLVMYQLRLLLGPQATRTLLRRVTASYRGQFISTRSFIMQTQSVAGVDLRGFFYGWVYATPQRPVLAVEWTAVEETDGTWSLKLAGRVDTGVEDDERPMVTPILVRMKVGSEAAMQMVVFTEAHAEYFIRGIPEEPKAVSFEGSTFPGKIDLKKAKK